MKRLKSELRQVSAARFLACLLLVVLMLGMTAPSAQAAGIYTHTWFVEEAIQRLSAQPGYGELVGILNRYPGVVNYGAIFPDISYLFDSPWAEDVHDSASIGYHNYGKYLEFLTSKNYDKRAIDLQTAYYKEFLRDSTYGAWLPPFRASLMGGMRDQFSKNPRSELDEKMIAFLFGVIAHQEADGPWHWNYADCNDPNAGGIGWGLECAAIKDHAYWDPLTREVQLDQYLFHYDPSHWVDFNFLSVVEPLIYKYRGAPSKSVVCLFNHYDQPLWCGQAHLQDLWGVATKDVMGANDVMKNFLETYVPGGTHYGAALVAAAWMDTWDRVAPAVLPIGQYRSLQSYNYPSHYVRHQNSLLRIDPIVTALDRRDATFKIVPGLAGAGCVSLESFNYPNHYLVDSRVFEGERRVELKPLPDDQWFRQRATFCPKRGRADLDKVSLESYTDPGLYLRHFDYRLRIDGGDTALFAADATFSVVAPLGLTPVYLPVVIR